MYNVNTILSLLDKCVTADKDLCHWHDDPDGFRGRLLAVNDVVTEIKQKLDETTPGLPWRPISTAPLDGTRILLYWPDLYSTPYIAVGYRNPNKYVRNSRPYWSPDNSHGAVAALRVHHPTHWQPLPLPPEGAK